MCDIVIRTQNLGKKYRLGHRTERQCYSVLSDVILDKLGALLRTLRVTRRCHNGDTRDGCTRPHDPLGLNSAPSWQEDFWALKDVSFDVKRGDVLGIIGQNGAGKSTLLKILSRITEPTTGQIEIEGRVASLLEVGTGFHPELTGRENVYLNGAILGMTRAEIRSRFDEIVAFAEVERFLDTPVKRYSSGMYVRLAFAVAAHLNSEILIVDEVLAVGDDKFQKRCLGKLRRIRESGKTVLFVSHQLAILKELCNRGLWIRDGQATIFDSMTAALTNYLEGQKPVSTEVGQRSTHVMSVQMENGGTHVFFGDALSITTRLRNLPCMPIGFTVDIKNSQGRRLCLLATNPHDGVVLPRKQEFEVTLVMNRCWFAPGQYLVDVAVTEPGVRIIEEVGNALQFEVHPSRVGGSLAYDFRFGDFFPPHSWEIGG